MTTTRKAQESLGLIIHTTFPQSTSRIALPGTTDTVIFEFSQQSDAADAFMLIRSLKDDMGAAAILDVMHIGFRVCVWFASL